MKTFIVANWKCNPTTLAEAKRLFNSIKKGLRNIKGAEAVVCPPFIYLSILGAFAFAKSYGGLALGSQDCFWEKKGAFTGEISSVMLKNLGCKYVIIGHSERRIYFGETNEIVNKKIKAVIKAGLTPILCVGETGEEKEKGETPKILRTQIEKGLKKISKTKISKLIIAYEPIWAIGTGKSCEVNEAMSAVLFVRKILSRLYNRSLAEKIPVLYGGSVNSKNAKDFIYETGINGLLVGGASLEPKEFIKIVKTVVKS